MRNWEPFIRRHTSKKTRKISKPVRLYACGTLHVTDAIYKELGEPDAFLFMFDIKERVIGLKPTTSKNEYAYRVNKQKSAKSMACARFCKHYDIDMSVNRHLDGFIEDGILIIPLNDSKP